MTQESQTLPGGTILQGKNGARYVIEELLGTGGFSSVYRIQDRRSKHIFALKEIINAYDRDRRHLIIEAELLKRQQHPSLPQVYQVFEDIKNNRIYLLMDYIEGKDLETLRRERPELRFSLVMAMMLMAPVVDAINYLHQQSPPIIHRDIKPANIIVPSGAGQPYLVDFGLAKEYTEEKTTNVFRYGTPGYAAPEQYGQGTNLRTDIYGLGATFYTLLTGQVPPDALARSLTTEKSDPLQDANQICPEIPGAVAAVLQRSMCLNYTERFETIEEFWQELNAAIPSPLRMHTEPSTPLPTPPQQANPANASANPNPKTPSSPRITLAQVKPVVYISTQKALLLILLTVILVALTVGSAIFYRIRMNSQYYTTMQVSKTAPAQLTPDPTPTQACAPATASSSRPPAIGSYPPLETCYMGTVYDLATKTKTALFLTNVQQRQNIISGDFWGLGYVGKFNGSVTADGGVAFDVILQKLGVTLHFQGIIKLGGDMTGNFTTLANDTMTSRGESGEWYLCTAADTLCYQSTPQPTASTP